MAVNANSRKVAFKGAISERLEDKGFKAVNQARMDARLKEEGHLKAGKSCGMVLPGEMVFNRGLGSTASSYFVFVGEDKGKGIISGYYTNPDSGPNAPMREHYWPNGKKGKVKPGQEYCIRKVYSGGGNPEKFADDVVANIVYFANLKARQLYWMENHFHMGSMMPGFSGNVQFQDDGSSRFDEAMRTLAAFNRDFVAVTCHNAFGAEKFRAMQIIAEEMGMIMVPGMELTVPAPKLIPNGSHVCAWGADAATMEEIKEIAFKGRLDYEMHPFNNGPSLFEVIPALHKALVEKGKLFMGIAHPLNMYKPGHNVFSTGLISSLEYSQESFVLADVERLFRYFGATEAWNTTVSSQYILSFKTAYLQEYANEIVSRHLPGVAVTSNSFAFAFAMEMAATGQIPNSFFGSDDHTTAQMNYLIEGANQASGHTVIDLSSVYAKLSSKPTAGQLIWWLNGNEVSMRAHVYAEQKDGFIRVPDGREERNASTQALRKKMSDEGYKEYKRAILADVAMLIGKGHGDWVANLERDYDYLKIWDPK